MKKIGLKMTDRVSGHIENFLEIHEQYGELYDCIIDDLSDYLHRSGFTDEEIMFVQDIVSNIFDKIRLINYLTNEEEKNKDIGSIIWYNDAVNDKGDKNEFQKPIIFKNNRLQTRGVSLSYRLSSRLKSKKEG